MEAILPAQSLRRRPRAASMEAVCPSSAITPTATLTRTDGRRRRSKPITGPSFSPLEQDPDESLWGDACVPGGWLAAVSLGDEQGQGRVHGGGAMAPFFTGSSVPSSSSDQPPCIRPHDIAMSALAMEFCNLNIWRLDVVRDHLSISPASIWESVRRSSSSGGSSSDSAASRPSSSGSFIGTSSSSSSNGAGFNQGRGPLNSMVFS
ncbi:hypothetical protein PVAP13_5NG367905 [Panicum virgatum]|uniref:Uncharacterized protein n=1 Tax=Panicum virgatum TaxID=38727 RepID=A0A8T0RUP7_PANVG|nr:hypothetical protein PVAP13_5NG367905 [Panicum virgatum]